MRIEFLGAAGEVTGSCYLIESRGTKFLIDCGMFQGGRDAHAKNLGAVRLDPRQIAFVVLSHAHIDHSGLIPRLVALGFRGRVYCTPATAALLQIMLPDSAHVQEAEAAWQNRRRHVSGKFARADAAPLYTVNQALLSLDHLEPVDYDRPFSPQPGLEFVFRDAGHILGSAIVECTIGAAPDRHRLVVSGDLGQPDRPLMRDPARIAHADVLLIESTYGNRLHKTLEETEAELVGAISETFARGGNVVIPAFAVGRTQEVVHVLAKLVRGGRLPDLTVFVDSPMATAASATTLRFARLLDDEARSIAEWMVHNRRRFNLRFTATVRDSMAINQVTGGAVIIAASGMCNAGRILHHLSQNLPRRQSSVVITGFQAQGTLGRRLVDGAREVNLFGERVPVKARLHTIGGLSAHADQAGLLAWLTGFRKAPRRTFVVHGERQNSIEFADAIRTKLRWTDVIVPSRGDAHDIGCA
ncbi:MAG: MBL fold metallo-hydrolase [Burkholderiales bacterium]|nr:MBL fold metallo-hydrolase [Burkholderiales bacterium]